MKRLKLAILAGLLALLAGLGWLLPSDQSQLPESPDCDCASAVQKAPRQMPEAKPAQARAAVGTKAAAGNNLLTVADDVPSEKETSKAVAAEAADLPEVKDVPECPRYPNLPVHAYRTAKLPPKVKGGAEGELREWLVKPNPEAGEHHVEEEYFPDDTGTMVLTARREYVANQVVMTVDGETTDEAFAARIAKFGGRIKNVLMTLEKGRRILSVDIPEVSLDAAAKLHENLSATAGTLSVDYDDIATINSTPNDSKFSQLWGMTQVKAQQAWDIIHDAPNVVVAVLDSGINYNHEDLAGNMWVNPSMGSVAGFSNDRYGAKCINGVKSGDPMDDVGHGTHCAGIIGAVGNNGKGVAGVSWKVKLMALKAGCRNDQGGAVFQISDQISMMEYAIQKNANIINCSFGGYTTENSQRKAAIEKLRNAGIMVVCAAGNEGQNIDSVTMYPACHDVDNVLAVAATSSSGGLGLPQYRHCSKVSGNEVLI